MITILLTILITLLVVHTINAILIQFTDLIDCDNDWVVIWLCFLISLPLSVVYALIKIPLGFCRVMKYGCVLVVHSPARWFVYTRNPFKVRCISKALKKKFKDRTWYFTYSKDKNRNELLLKIKNHEKVECNVIYK